MKTILVDAVNTFVLRNEGVFVQMYELLEQYPNKKIILINANDAQMIEFGLQNLPYEVFTLKHNPDKKNSQYFIHMLEHFNLNSKDVLYFEHNVDAVKSAQSVGIKTYYYNKETRDLVALKQFIDKNLFK